MIGWWLCNLHLLWFICLGRQQQLEAEHQYVEADQDLHKRRGRSVEPPAERPGERRMAEMKKLYGAEAAKIQAMEAAMQLIFDRNCDKKQPKYWPIIPLKLWVPGLRSDLALSCRDRCLSQVVLLKEQTANVGFGWALGLRPARAACFFALCSFYTVSNGHRPVYLHTVVK